MHEAFNICVKYGILHFWHGRARDNDVNRRINPLNDIKRTIVARNLQRDLDSGRANRCSFARMFLSGGPYGDKKYRLAEPFRRPDIFDTPAGRKRFVWAILHPCSYSEECTLCRQTYEDRFYHFLTVCRRIRGFRKELYLKLALYGFPCNRLPLDKTVFVQTALERKVWLKCLNTFLEDTDF